MSESIGVLHVDGDPEFRAPAAEALRRENERFRIHSETGVAAAMDRLDAAGSAVDCVVSSYRTSDGDGVTFLETVRADHGDLPFVLFVGDGSEAIAARAMHAGVTDYVRKDREGALAYLARRIVRAVEESRADARVETNRHRFLQLADRLEEVVWMMDPSFGEVLYMNRAFEEVWDVSRNDMGSSLSAHLERIHPEDRGTVREAMERQVTRLGEDEVEPVEYSFRLGDSQGDVQWIESVSFPLLDRVGNVEAVGGISRDVTGRVERERRLEARIEQLDQASSFISHDLKNHLNVAEGSLDLYRGSGDPSDLDTIGDALARMKAVIDDMLQLVELDPTPPDLVPRVLSEPARAAWETVDTREARLEVVSDGEFEMSASHVRSMFENLFRNAVGHGGADVTVRVGTSPDGFYVEDTGRGIPADRYEAVFEHGFSTGYGGTGTGLTIVKRVAEQHGWSVGLGESEEGGARFEFTVRTPAGTGSDTASEGTA